MNDPRHSEADPLAETFTRDEDRARFSPRPRPALWSPLAVGALLALLLGWPAEVEGPRPAGLILEQVLGLIQSRYVETVDVRKHFDEGLDAMLRELDPNSRYIPRDRVSEFEGDTEGFFVGIGVVIQPAQDGIPPVIKSVLRDSPAEHALLAAGDQIIEVDGENVETSDLDAVSSRIHGAPGSHVRLRIRREPPGEDFERAVTRAKVNLPSIEAVRLYEGHSTGPVGYFRLRQFQTDTSTEILRTVDNLVDAGATHLILDLRDNRGGLLHEAVAVCDIFLSDGLVLSTKGRANADKPTLYKASEETPCPDTPLIVLVDSDSASASEIVAAALQDRRRALLVGTRTYGKWTVQDVIRLPDHEGIVKLTTKGHHPPEGRWVSRDERGRRQGIVPNVRVTTDSELERALRLRWRQELLDHINTPYDVVRTPLPSFEDAGESSVVDGVLVRALGVFSSPGDYEKLLAVDPDPAALDAVLSARAQDGITPRGSTLETEAGEPHPALESKRGDGKPEEASPPPTRPAGG